MKVYNTGDIRNVVLVGHGNVGKTTFTEAALFASGATTRLGTIADQNTVSDYDDDEHQRKFSINLSLIPIEWQDRKINLIDTPGYADFVSEVLCGIRAADLALVVVDAQSGPEVGTDRVWQFADNQNLPRMIFVNRMDRENADFDAVLAQMQEKWGHRIAPLQLAIGAASEFNGVIDLIDMKAYTGDGGEEGPIPAEYEAHATELRNQLIESIVETDEALMEKFFADEAISEDELRDVLHRAFCAGDIVPVTCGAASRLMGVRQTLRNIVSIGPSPDERPPLETESGEIACTDDGPLAAQVFKTMADPYVGRLSYIRVFRGVLGGDSHVWNANQDRDERVGTLYIQRGKEQEATREIHAGDIGVVAKLTETHTGDTLCDKGSPVILPPLTFPAPVFSMSVRPGSKGAVDKLGPSLQRIIEEDPGLRLERNETTHEMVLSGLGDAHLDVAIERLRRKFNVEVELNPPRVAYLETISRPSKADYTHKKQTGGHGQYGRVAIEIKPQPRGAGLTFETAVVGGSVPREFFPAVEKGIRETAEHGVVAGYTLTDCTVVLYDGKHHPVDSSEMAFKTAASQALKQAVDGASPVLLEPIMHIAVTVPEEFAGDIVSDLNTKRARIMGMTAQGNLSTIEAEVPQGEVLRYAADLRSLTQGRGSFELEFAHYGEVPAHIAQHIIEESKVEAEA